MENPVFDYFRLDEDSNTILQKAIKPGVIESNPSFLDFEGIRWLSEKKPDFSLLNTCWLNLIFEKYLEPRYRISPVGPGLLKKFYYNSKFIIPRYVQLKLQKQFVAVRKRSITFPQWPIDMTMRDLIGYTGRNLLQFLGRQKVPIISLWPEGHSWGLGLSHDVETLAGLQRVGSIRDIEMKHFFRSTFLFVPERYRQDCDLMKSLVSQGCEIAVHGLKHDGKLFWSEQLFEKRRLLIERYARDWQAVGFRSPALHRVPEWIARFDFLYDSSYLDVANFEFQPGGCLMWYPYRLSDTLIELPITVPFDHTVINLFGDETPDVFIKKMDAVRQANGLALLDFHPDYLNSNKRLDIYNAVLNYAKSHNPWVGTLKEIARWYRDRLDSKVIISDSGQSIDGPAANRAKVWWLTGDGLDLS